MAKRSNRAAKRKINVEADAGEQAVRLGSQPEENVSVSLKHFRRETECFSEWAPKDLKEFGRTVEKLRGYTVTILMGRKRLCERVRNLPKKSRFTRPADVSRDLPIYEIKVDVGNSARIHGFFDGSIFHLLWLDRNHELCKD